MVKSNNSLIFALFILTSLPTLFRMVLTFIYKVHKMNTSLKLSLLASALSSCFISVANANNDVSKSDDAIDGVVVTATRTEQRISDTASSVSLVTQQELSQTMPLTIGEAIESIPNVTVTDANMPIFSKVSIRGSDSNQITYLIDGVRQDNYSISGSRPNGFFIDPELVKQVEVRRGGGSSLYGNGGIGGTIALTTKSAEDLLKPDEQFGAIAKVGYDDASREWAKGVYLFGRMDSGDLLLGYSRRDGEEARSSKTGRRSTTPLETTGDAFIAKSTIMLSSASALSLTYNYDKFNYDRGASNPSFDHYENEQHRITGSWDYSSGDLVNLKANLQYVRGDNAMENERTGYKDKFESISTNLQNTSEFSLGVAHTLTYGFDASRTKQSAVDNLGFSDTSRPDSRGIDAGVFIEDNIALTDIVTLSPVLRWSYYDRKSNEGLKSKSDSKLSPGVTLSVAPTENLNIYGSVNSGYRPPMLDEMFFAMSYPSTGITSVVIANPEIKPETSLNYEIGLNSQLSRLITENDRLQLKGAVFYDKVKDLISADMVDFDPSTMTMYFKTVNVGEVVRKGAEVSADYSIGNASLHLGWGLVHAIDKETNERLPGIVPQTATLRTTWAVPSKDLKLWYRLNWYDGGKSSVDNYQTQEENIHLPSYCTHALGLQWTPSVANFADFTTTVAVENIANKTYQELNGSYGYGRTVRVNVTARF